MTDILSRERAIVSAPTRGGRLDRRNTDDPGPHWQSLLSPPDKVGFLLLIFLWCATLLYLWVWWLDPAHVLHLGSFVTISILLTWITLLPLYFVVIVYGARKLTGPLALPVNSRIAMVVTKAPSEPFEVVRATIDGMLAQDVTHDTWLADEEPTEATRQWCLEHGVKLSTRFGRTEYHRGSWPRRTRCKEGNLAFFYDNFGYDNYDFVAQLDADHVPKPTYLREMLLGFADPGVGYVSAPSICDANASESWSARSRLYVEAALHGSLQAGYNNGWAPLCIGSHYAVRTTALRQIGGLGPELAEDHSTTLIMNANGWRGVHAIDAIAHGDGPHTFADLVTQEFQWSRSLVTILLQYTPRYIRGLPVGLRFQFLFSQLWYPLFSLFMALTYALPLAALLNGSTLVDVSFPEFMAHAAPSSVVLLIMVYRWRASGSYRPADAKVLSWEGMIFLFARWPWSLAGTAAATRDWITGSFVDFRVTPKGGDAAGPLPTRVLAPYVALSLLSTSIALLVRHPGSAGGFYVFAICNGSLYAATVIVIVVAHIWENGCSIKMDSMGVVLQLAVALVMLVALGGAMRNRGLPGIQALAWGSGKYALARETFRFSGAGQPGTGFISLRLGPHWISTSIRRDRKSFQSLTDINGS